MRYFQYKTDGRVIFLKRRIGLLLLAALLLCGCQKAPVLAPSVSGDMPAAEGVTIELDAKSYDKDAAAPAGTLYNESEQEITFGVDYTLELLTDGGWMLVEYKEDVSWIEIAYVVAPDGSFALAFSLESCYGALPAGQYRAVKVVYADGVEGGMTVYAPFELT